MPPKRTKAVLKQVVGSPFTAVAESEEEKAFIKKMVRASKLNKLWDNSLSRNKQECYLNSVLEQLVSELKSLLHNRVMRYISHIAERLMDEKVRIKWSMTGNSCQTFCDSLIDLEQFGSLVPQDPGSNTLPYLMSFICRPGAYHRPVIRTKFSVPNGLTEEYFLKFQWRIHEESDIFDSLQEYWYDWGAFGRTLYPFQDMFPWDCSEAFGRNPIRCSDCSISKHVWAFPFDSWSIISLHLIRHRFHYQSNAQLSDKDWMQNRLMLLKAEDALTTSALAMARSVEFQRATKWIWDRNDPHIDRVKLGGIHRAQPWSRFIHRGVYHNFLVASWSHLGFEDQKLKYEELRNFRMEMLDVGVRSSAARPMQLEYRQRISPRNSGCGVATVVDDGGGDYGGPDDSAATFAAIQ